MTKNEAKANLPHFKYHSDPIKTGAFKLLQKPRICECCGKETFVYYPAMYI